MRLVILSAAIAVMAGSLWNNPVAALSADRAAKAKLAWAAYECSVLAGFAGKEELSAKLFTRGYESAIQFISDYQAGSVPNEQVQSTVPIGIMLVMGGPTADFVAGRIYESVQQLVIDALNGQGQIFVDSDLRKLKAQSKLREQNCELLRQ